jgi:putative ABC transport system ATP-binding protein
MAIVETRGLTRVYKQGSVDVHALRGVDLDIEAGEFTALVGPSGSGKSTLLNMIGALDTPTTGTVTVDGHELSSMTKRQLSALRRDRIGFVFQAYNLIPVLTAMENAEAVLALQGMPVGPRRDKVAQVLTRLGLGDMLDRRPDQLSGGQQQRVAIARAIVADPAVVLADEPTANVDSETAESLLQLMLELNQEQCITFIFSTHDPRVVAHARRVVRLVDGKIDAGSV